MSTKPILYSYWRSSCAWRVRIALNLKGIEYDYRTINLLSEESLNSPDFVAANPAKKVPALVVDGVAFGESLAIIEYLEEKYPEKSPLLPKSLTDRAKARAIFLQVASAIQPLQNLKVLKYLNNKEAGFGATWAKHWISSGLASLEEMVAASAGEFAVGDQVTLADLSIPSIIYNARRFNVDVSVYPTLLRLDEKLAKIEAFRNAEPDRQPDANLNA